MDVAKVASIPFPFLGPGVSLIDFITAPSRSKRLTDWCEQLRVALNELHERVKGLTPEALAKNEAFISLVAHATQAALRTHRAEKREALLNAVMNAVAGTAPSEDMQLIFLNLVDTFTPTHLAVLRDFQTKDHPSRVQYRKQRDLTQVVCDLRDRGLLRDARPLVAREMDAPEALVMYDWEITNLGKQFLEFIKLPNLEKL